MATLAERYRVIYADPPWSFATYSAKGRGRCADAHYDVMGMDALAALPVADWADEHCILLMWATDPLLPQAFDLIRSWGFTYKTVGFYWAKLNRSASAQAMTERSFFTGLGYWTRANVEQCLLATRGKPQRKGRDVPRLVVAPRREHSRKPDEVYHRIERLADGPYLEMFARAGRPGWSTWGNQVELFDQGSVATRRWASHRPEPEAIARYASETG